MPWEATVHSTAFKWGFGGRFARSHSLYSLWAVILRNLPHSKVPRLTISHHSFEILTYLFQALCNLFCMISNYREWLQRDLVPFSRHRQMPAKSSFLREDIRRKGTQILGNMKMGFPVCSWELCSSRGSKVSLEETQVSSSHLKQYSGSTVREREV